MVLSDKELTIDTTGKISAKEPTVEGKETMDDYGYPMPVPSKEDDQKMPAK